MGAKTLGKADTPSNTGTHVGRQWERRGGKRSRRRTHHPTIGNKKGDQGDKTSGMRTQKEDKGRQDPGRADIPSNNLTKGNKKGGKSRDKHSKRRTHHPTKGNKKGDKGRQDPQEGGHTSQQRETRRGTMGDKGRQDPREADTPSNKGNKKRTPNSTLFVEQEGAQSETKGDKTLRKADSPSNKGKQEGAPWETRPALEKGDTPSNKGQTRRGTMGDKGRQDPWEGGYTIQWETRPPRR